MNSIVNGATAPQSQLAAERNAIRRVVALMAQEALHRRPPWWHPAWRGWAWLTGLARALFVAPELTRQVGPGHRAQSRDEWLDEKAKRLWSRSI